MSTYPSIHFSLDEDTLKRCVLNVLVTIPACSPSAPRASRALQGPARQCTSAASRANPCKTAPASCRRPGTRTGRRQGRHPTPGSPALWTRAKQKRKLGQKGRLTKEKKRKGTFLLQEHFRRGNYLKLQFLINSKKSPPGEMTGITATY